MQKYNFLNPILKVINELQVTGKKREVQVDSSVMSNEWRSTPRRNGSNRILVDMHVVIFVLGLDCTWYLKCLCTFCMEYRVMVHQWWSGDVFGLGRRGGITILTSTFFLLVPTLRIGACLSVWMELWMIERGGEEEPKHKGVLWLFFNNVTTGCSEAKPQACKLHVSVKSLSY